MSMFRKLITAFVAMFAAASLSMAYAEDAAIEQAKAKAIVGEMYTGYLGIVDDSKVTPDLKRRVDEVNAGRLAAYTQISQKTGQPVSTVAALTAEKQIARAMSGNAVKPGASEPWTIKP
jgi:uncharacterized protein